MGKKLNLKEDFKGKYPSFAQILTDRICGKFSQNAIIIIDGKTGSGKSLASLRLAWDCALLFAQKLGGRPEKYFNLSHVGILTAQEAIRITKDIKQHGIYILDDAGGEMLNCRKFMSEQNDVMNKLLMTFRTNENLLILSSPDKGFIDKVGRVLMHYKITMSIKIYSKGISLGKLSTVRRVSTKDHGSNLYPFLRMHGTVFNYLAFREPPTALRVEYEKRRKAIEREMNLEAVADLEESTKKMEDKKAKKELQCKGKPEIIADDTARKNNAMLYKTLVRDGMSAVKALAKASDVTGLKLSQNTVLKDYNRLCLGVES